MAPPNAPCNTPQPPSKCVNGFTGPTAVFDAIADFLESCKFVVAAEAIRSQRAWSPCTVEPDFPSRLRQLAESTSLVASELESTSKDCQLQKHSAAKKESALVQLVDGLLDEVVRSAHGLTDEALNRAIDTTLTNAVFADLQLLEGHVEDPCLQLAKMPEISELEVSQYWEHVESGLETTESPVATCTTLAEGGGMPQPAASAHYIPRRSRETREEAESFDEYEDEDDPGYVIRDLSEVELLEELSQQAAEGPVLTTATLASSEDGDELRKTEGAKRAADVEVAAATGASVDVASEAEPRHKIRQHPHSGDSFYPVEYEGTIFDSFNLRVVFERGKTGFEESKEFSIRMNSVVAARYQILEYLGSAAFSRAVQCLDLETNQMVCMKIIKNDKDFFDQSLDEIKLLKYINVNGEPDERGVLRLYDYFYHKEHLIIITELLRDNLYEFSKFNRESGGPPYFTLGRIQRVTKQVLSALEYVHSLRLIHCDLKPENILMKSYSRCEVKVIDFGSSCFVDDHLSSYVQSRSYRAPEVMLGLPYGQKVDLWSLGCIIAELWTGHVLFANNSVQSLLARILGIIGEFPSHLMMRGRHVPQYFTQDGRLYQEIDVPPCPERGRRLNLLMPKKTSLEQRMHTDCTELLDLLRRLLHLDPERRPTATEALRHPFIAQCKFPDGL